MSNVWETRYRLLLEQLEAQENQAGRGTKQKRADLRLARLGLVITRGGEIPLVAHAYSSKRPDITQFAAMIDLLVSRHTALASNATA